MMGIQAPGGKYWTFTNVKCVRTSAISVCGHKGFLERNLGVTFCVIVMRIIVECYIHDELEKD